MGLNYDLPEKTWVAVGDEANRERGLENGIWGLQPQLKHHWDNELECHELTMISGL